MLSVCAYSTAPPIPALDPLQTWTPPATSAPRTSQLASANACSTARWMPAAVWGDFWIPPATSVPTSAESANACSSTPPPPVTG